MTQFENYHEELLAQDPFKRLPINLSVSSRDLHKEKEGKIEIAKLMKEARGRDLSIRTYFCHDTYNYKIIIGENKIK